MSVTRTLIPRSGIANSKTSSVFSYWAVSLSENSSWMSWWKSWTVMLMYERASWRSVTLISRPTANFETETQSTQKTWRPAGSGMASETRVLGG